MEKSSVRGLVLSSSLHMKDKEYIYALDCFVQDEKNSDQELQSTVLWFNKTNRRKAQKLLSKWLPEAINEFMSQGNSMLDLGAKDITYLKEAFDDSVRQCIEWHNSKGVNFLQHTSKDVEEHTKRSSRKPTAALFKITDSAGDSSKPLYMRWENIKLKPEDEKEKANIEEDTSPEDNMIECVDNMEDQEEVPKGNNCSDLTSMSALAGVAQPEKVNTEGWTTILLPLIEFNPTLSDLIVTCSSTAVLHSDGSFKVKELHNAEYELHEAIFGTINEYCKSEEKWSTIMQEIKGRESPKELKFLQSLVYQNLNALSSRVESNFVNFSELTETFPDIRGFRPLLFNTQTTTNNAIELYRNFLDTEIVFPPKDQFKFTIDLPRVTFDFPGQFQIKSQRSDDCREMQIRPDFCDHLLKYSQYTIGGDGLDTDLLAYNSMNRAHKRAMRSCHCERLQTYYRILLSGSRSKALFEPVTKSNRLRGVQMATDSAWQFNIPGAPHLTARASFK